MYFLEPIVTRFPLSQFTLKALSKIVADDIWYFFCFFFLFSEKIRLGISYISHANASLIFSEKYKKIRTSFAAVVSSTLGVKIGFFDFAQDKEVVRVFFNALHSG